MQTLSLRALSQVRLLGRQPDGSGPVPLFYTASGFECIFTGSELALCMEAGFALYEPWISVELNGAWIARFPVQAGRSEVTLCRGMTPGVPKHIRVLKDVQAMHGDPDHYLLLTGLRFSGGGFLPLPEPAYRLEFVGDSITSGEGAIGAAGEEDWVSPFFSAVNHYARMTADALGAEWRIVSQSGWGLLSSWDNDPRCRVMAYYDTVCGLADGPHNAALGAQQPCRFDAWLADAVILNLGTNDNNAMDNPPWADPATGRQYAQRPTPEHLAALEQSAVDAIKQVRARNPQAWILWAFGMLGAGSEDAGSEEAGWDEDVPEDPGPEELGHQGNSQAARPRARAALRKRAVARFITKSSFQGFTHTMTAPAIVGLPTGTDFVFALDKVKLCVYT